MFFFTRKPLEKAEFYNSTKGRVAAAQMVRFGNLDPRERQQSDLPEFLAEDMASLDDAVIEANANRCAFCERTRKDLRGFRFRPASNTEPAESRDMREYYFWLSLSLENIFPICSSCRPKFAENFPMRRGGRARPTPAMFKVAEFAMGLDRNGPDAQLSETGVEAITRLFFEGSALAEEILPKGYSNSGALDELTEIYGIDFHNLKNLSDYSVRQNEQPLFCEPGQIQTPAKHFSVDFDGTISSVREFDPTASPGRQSRAGATIRHYNLNAPNTVEERRDALDQRIEDLIHSTKLRLPNYNPLLFDFEQTDFGSAWYLMLHKIGMAWARQTDIPARLTMQSLRGTFLKLLDQSNVDVLRAVVDELRSGPGADGSEAISGVPLSANAKDPQRSESDADTDLVQATRPKLNIADNAHILSVDIKNYKALEALKIDMPQLPANATTTSKENVTPAILMLGENACGKSSILEAIAIACVGNAAFATLDLDLYKLVLNPRYMGVRGAEDSEVTFQERTCEIIVELSGGKTYRTRFSRSLPLERMVSSDGKNWRAIGADDGLNIFAFGAHRLFGAKSRNDGEGANICTLFDNAALLADPEARLIALYERDPQALDEVVARLRQLISIDGNFRSIEIVQDPDRPDQRTCEMRIVKELPDEKGELQDYVVDMPLSAVSSGYRTIIALFCDIVSGLLAEQFEEELDYKTIRRVLDAPCTVLIDEIEAHLHPRWKMQVIDGLREVLKNAFFVLTSHDPLCIRGMSNEEVFVLNRGRSPETDSVSDVLERVAFEPGDIRTELFTVEQLLTSNLFNLLTTENHKREVYWAEQIENDGGRAQFEEEVADALPIGDSVVTRLVQEAVWEYLKETKVQVQNPKAREVAVRKIKEHLQQASF